MSEKTAGAPLEVEAFARSLAAAGIETGSDNRAAGYQIALWLAEGIGLLERYEADGKVPNSKTSP
jgi:hypothetical protein